MRKIKFKSVNLETNEIYSPLYLTSENIDSFDLIDVFHPADSIYHSEVIGPKNEPLMEYTGYNDANDEEIYEHFILTNKKKGISGIVCMLHGSWVVMLKSSFILLHNLNKDWILDGCVYTRTDTAQHITNYFNRFLKEVPE